VISQGVREDGYARGELCVIRFRCHLLLEVRRQETESRIQVSAFVFLCPDT